MSIVDLERVNPGWYFDIKDQLKRHIYQRSQQAFDAGDAARDAISTLDQLKERQQFIRSRFIEKLGGLPPMDTPLDPRKVGEVAGDGFRIEKIIFESRPKTFVTADLYVPDGITCPRGAVLFVCGHAYEAKQYPEYQIVCRHLVKAGLVVMAQDPVGQGERLSYHEKSIGGTTINWGTYEHDYAGWPAWNLGTAIARYFVHDAMRGVDYLLSRPEVDPARIGITGNSGGGTQSCLMMVCDPRLAAAAPCTFVMNRESYMYAGGAQDQEQIWPGMTALGFDHEDVLLMMCPKPVRVLSVTSDFFPIEGTRRTVERCKRIWDVAGAPGGVDMVKDFSDHAYTVNLARASTEFFARRLLDREVEPSSWQIEPEPPGKLNCTQSGQVRGEIDGARFLYDESVDRLAELESARQAMPDDQLRKGALDWLRQRVFNARKVCDLNPRFCPQGQRAELSAEMCFWFSQEGMICYAHCLRSFRFAGQELPVTMAVWDDGAQCLRDHIDWIRRTCDSGRAVVVLNVSGVGAAEPHLINGGSPRAFYGPIHKLTDDLIWLDDSLAALRTYDVLRAVDVIELWPGLSGGDTRLYAHGRHGLYARLAAVLDERVRGIEVIGGLTSYADLIRSRYYDEHDIMSVVFPDVLKYFDLPDVDRWTTATLV